MNFKKIKISSEKRLQKPNWIRAPSVFNRSRFFKVKKTLIKDNLLSVCESAYCPNIGECFGKGTATFLIMGNICTRNCPFCFIEKGKPYFLDINEPKNLVNTISRLQLSYVVITSVDRDDLSDGGASHFVECIKNIRAFSSKIMIEVLLPDFRGCLETALSVFKKSPPDVINHNLETVKRLYKKTRPGANYVQSLRLLSEFKRYFPKILTKSGLMVGIGEQYEEIIHAMHDMRLNGVNLLTIGQYLQPSIYHLPVIRYIPRNLFFTLKKVADSMGFVHAYIGPMVRSSYHANTNIYNIPIESIYN